MNRVDRTNVELYILFGIVTRSFKVALKYVEYRIVSYICLDNPVYEFYDILKIKMIKYTCQVFASMTFRCGKQSETLIQ